MDDKKSNKKASQKDLDDFEIFLKEIENIDSQKIAKNKENDELPIPIAKKSQYQADIDLHQMTVKEAKKHILHTLDSLPKHSTYQLRIITGRGRHSKNGSVLGDEIYKFVKETLKNNIKKIDPNPSHSSINGISVRGHFVVEFTLV